MELVEKVVQYFKKDLHYNIEQDEDTWIIVSSYGGKVQVRVDADKRCWISAFPEERTQILAPRTRFNPMDTEEAIKMQIMFALGVCSGYWRSHE